MSEEVDIALLQAKVNILEENENDLEERLNELERNIRLGKGIFLGVFFTLGAFGFTAADKISATVTKWFT